MEVTNSGMPAPDSIDISIFGPGIGECCVFHIGDGKWFVVDSCTDTSGSPVALTYLQQLGVDVDLARLKNRTNQIFLTAPVRGARPSHSRSGVDEAMMAMARDRQILRSDCGQVRVRFPFDDQDCDLQVECFGQASSI